MPTIKLLEAGIAKVSLPKEFFILEAGVAADGWVTCQNDDPLDKASNNQKSEVGFS
jgi:hypothetical protein